MAITVRFFASLRESLDRAEATVAGSEAATVAEVWRAACPGVPMPPNTLMAVNARYAAPHEAVRDGDEVAFFPPVTGG